MKRILAIIVSIAMMLSLAVVPVAAAGASAPTVTVESLSDEVKPGDTVTLAVKIENNPGFTDTQWNIDYDPSTLKLSAINSTHKVSVPGLGTFTVAYIMGMDKEGNEVPHLVQSNVDDGKFVSAGADLCETNGTLFTLTFIVEEGATAGKTEVKIVSERFAAVGELIDANYVPGIVTVAGDPDGDDNTGDDNTGDDNTGGSTTGGSTTGGSTTGGSTTGGSTTGGSTTGGSTTGGSTTGGTTTPPVIDVTDGDTTDNDGEATWEYKEDGETKTVTVKHDVACVVIIQLADGSFVAVKAVANEDGSYDFDVSEMAEGTSIIIVVKGDFDLDGTVDMNDATGVMNAWVNDTSVTAISRIASDMDKSEDIDMNDATDIMNAWVNNTSISW